MRTEGELRAKGRGAPMPASEDWGKAGLSGLGQVTRVWEKGLKEKEINTMSDVLKE